MTRAEAEAAVRKFPRTCKGLELIDRATQKTFFDRIYTARHEELPELVTDIIALRRSVGLPKHMSEEIEAGDPSWRLPSLLDMPGGKILAWCIETLRAHQSNLGNPCGRDFNDEICANPFDGAVRNYACPACGLAGTYRSPLYD